MLIGHSFGGLIVELLLDRGLGRAGVAMSPAPPKGILVLPFSSLKAAVACARASVEVARRRPADARGVHLRLREHVHARGRSAAYERYAVPETGQIFYEAGFANFHLHPPTEVHFKNDDRAPLLIVGADKDHTVPASLSKQAVREVREVARADRLPRVRGPSAPDDGRRGLGGGRGAIESWLDGVLDAAA